MLKVLGRGLEIMNEKNFTYKLVEKFDVEIQNDSEVLAESFDLAVDYENDTVAPATFEILYNPVAVVGSALRTAVTALKNTASVIYNASQSPIAEVVSFVGDLYSTVKGLYEDIRDRNYTNAFFDALGALAEVLDTVVDKLVEKVPLFGVAASMASFETSLLNVQNEYTQSGTVSDDAVDELALDGVDLVTSIVQTAAFFFPVGLLGKAAFMGVTEIVATGIKAIYLKASHNEKSIFESLFQAAFDGVYELVEDIKGFFKGKGDDYDDIDDDIKNAKVTTDSSTNITYDYSTENVLKVTNNYNQTTIYNMSELVTNITATDSTEVYNYSDGVTITGDDSGNVIYNYGKNVTIECKGGNDTVYNMGDNVTIKGVTGYD